VVSIVRVQFTMDIGGGKPPALPRPFSRKLNDGRRFRKKSVKSVTPHDRCYANHRSHYVYRFSPNRIV